MKHSLYIMYFLCAIGIFSGCTGSSFEMVEEVEFSKIGDLLQQQKDFLWKNYLCVENDQYIIKLSEKDAQTMGVESDAYSSIVQKCNEMNARIQEFKKENKKVVLCGKKEWNVEYDASPRSGEMYNQLVDIVNYSLPYEGGVAFEHYPRGSCRLTVSMEEDLINIGDFYVIHLLQVSCTDISNNEHLLVNGRVYPNVDFVFIVPSGSCAGLKPVELGGFEFDTSDIPVDEVGGYTSIPMISCRYSFKLESGMSYMQKYVALIFNLRVVYK